MGFNGGGGCSYWEEPVSVPNPRGDEEIKLSRLEEGGKEEVSDES